MLILNILAPILAIIAVGYIAAKYFGFTQMMEFGLIRIVTDIAVPITLMGALSKVEFDGSAPLYLLISYFIPAYAVFMLGMVIAAFYFKRDAAGQAITAIGFAFSNTVLIGIPVIYAAYGDQGIVILFMIVSIHGTGFLTLTTILLERANAANGMRASTANGMASTRHKVISALIRTPILYGVIAGFLLNIANIELPQMAEEFIKHIERALIGLSLLALGMGLSRARLAGRFSQNMILTLFKMILFPACVFCLSHYIFQLDPLMVKVATIVAALPCGAIVSIFAEKYDAGKNFAATATLMTNITALVTVTGWLLFLEWVL